ncbi:M20/M25/M40 family metallo-hydrolase [Bifidobacterium longum]|uniref:M20/M25/M40 family metallo-hydrolase n=1 Tax=Bifidobacterium longum TaxID=216816 RepID=UPI003D05E08A
MRGDIDGLPIQEQAGLPCASETPGYMHGCGHDYNMTTAFGAVLLLQGRRNRFAGTVKLIFQPAEESRGTAGNPTGAGRDQHRRGEQIPHHHPRPRHACRPPAPRSPKTAR